MADSKKQQAAKAKTAGGQQAATAVKKLANGLDPSIGKKTQFKKGQSGNPSGPTPGRVSLSTHIQNLLNDEEFSGWVPDVREGWKEVKGVPIKAIVQTAIVRAIAGEKESREWLAKYGYGVKIDPGEDGSVLPVAIVRIIDNGSADSRNQLPQ